MKLFRDSPPLFFEHIASMRKGRSGGNTKQDLSGDKPKSKKRAAADSDSDADDDDVGEGDADSVPAAGESGAKFWKAG